MVLVLLALQGCTVDDKHIVTESQGALPDIPTLGRRIDDVDVVLNIDSRTAYLVDQDIITTFLSNGWHKQSGDKDDFIGVVCFVFNETMTAIVAQCQVNIAIKYGDKMLDMPISRGSISVNEGGMHLDNASYVRKNVAELVRSQAIDAADASEERLRKILQ